MSEQAPSTYDEVPYIDETHPQTHPARLATVATVFGMTPPEVASCRVLELGCGNAGNLLSMAIGLPGARFVGIDLSARQIEQGRETVAALGLRNVDLRHGDICDVGSNWGTFDYIICHGVYSWVPGAIREKILAICKENSAPNGVAYVSYNTLPGWRLRSVVRDFMAFHAEPVTGATEKVRDALAMLEVLAQNTTDAGAYKTLLSGEWTSMRGNPEAYLFHEMLEPVNDPVYFREFAAAAARHGLSYLGDANVPTMIPGNFPPPLQEVLRRCASDVVRMEQYMDFMRNRSFRETLLVHDGAPPARKLAARALERMFVASQAAPVNTEPSLVQGMPETFRNPERGTFETRNALSKAAMLVLAECWPRGMRFFDLVTAARERCASARMATAATGERAVTMLQRELLRCYSGAVVDLHVWMPRYCFAPSARPEASALARWQSERASVVTNLRQERVPLDVMARRLLALLDGQCDRDAVICALARQIKAGAFALTSAKTGAAVIEDTAIDRAIGEAYDAWLPRLAEAALLVA
jgi:methyltransferase-like protein/2-polyprenyl-3-methyl-5-hydroxy-6-metoxy-1,4-benzoquinol methylase